MRDPVKIEPGQLILPDAKLRAWSGDKPLVVRVTQEAGEDPFLVTLSLEVWDMAARRALGRGSFDGDGNILVRPVDFQAGKGHDV